MPILSPILSNYSTLFPSGYSGSQVLRSGVIDSPYQRLYPSGDKGSYGYLNLSLNVYGVHKQSISSFTSNILSHQPLDILSYLRTNKTSLLDIQSVINSHTPIQLPIVIKGYDSVYNNLTSSIDYYAISNISTTISSHNYEQLNSIIKSITHYNKNLTSNLFGKLHNDTSLIYSTIYSHLAVNIIAFIRATNRRYRELYSIIQPNKLSGVYNLSTIITTHTALNLPILIHPRRASIINLYTNIFPNKLHAENSIISFILSHNPFNLMSRIKVFQRSPYNLYTSIIGLGTINLPSYINSVYQTNISANIYSIAPINLSAYLKVVSTLNLNAYLQAYHTVDISSYIKYIYTHNLNIDIATHSPLNLKASLKSYATNIISDLSANIVAFKYYSLFASLKTIPQYLLSSSLFGIGPFDLNSFIWGWQLADLSSMTTIVKSPNDVSAYINGSGAYSDINSLINSYNYYSSHENLKSFVQSYALYDLSTTIGTAPFQDLYASILSKGYSHPISASIFPKVIKLSTILQVHTMCINNLSATLNIFCRNQGTGFYSISSFLNPLLYLDLTSQIMSSILGVVQYDLSCTVGKKYLKFTIDKLPISIYIRDTYKELDILPIYFSIYGGETLLNSKITGIFQNYDISSSIFGIWLKYPVFTQDQGRVIVSKLDNEGEVTSIKDIELYFKSKVIDYFYVPGNSKVYKTNFTDRWEIGMDSYLVNDPSTILNRKLDRYLNIYKLSSFSSFDTVIKHAINYLTSTPTVELKVSINSCGNLCDLYSSISARTTISTLNTISASIIGVNRHLIMGFSNKVQFM